MSLRTLWTSRVASLVDTDQGYRILHLDGRRIACDEIAEALLTMRTLLEESTHAPICLCC